VHTFTVWQWSFFFKALTLGAKVCVHIIATAISSVKVTSPMIILIITNTIAFPVKVKAS
jgi:hypothetical protein